MASRNKKKQWYDTRPGITSALGTLEGFNKLIKYRQKASNDGEDLKEWVVLGTWWLSNNGHCMKTCDRINPREVSPEIEIVMTHDEVKALVKRALPEETYISLMWSYKAELPTDTVLCPVCGCGWSILSCHDAMEKHHTEYMDGSSYVGRMLKEFKKYLAKRSDGIYEVRNSEDTLRNDRFIDLTPRFSDPKSDWEKEAVKNKNGYVGLKEGINDEYIIQPGDTITVEVFEFYHSKCYEKLIYERTERQFRDVIQEAGFQNFTMTPIPNQYHNYVEYGPWFHVQTGSGVIVIGRRKRVVNIDTSGWNVPIDLRDLFSDEDVTKDRNHIHSWSREDTVQYLKTIRETAL